MNDQGNNGLPLFCARQVHYPFTQFLANRLRALEDDNRQLNQLVSSFAEDVNTIKASLTRSVRTHPFPKMRFQFLYPRTSPASYGDSLPLNGPNSSSPRNRQLNKIQSNRLTHHLSDWSTKFPTLAPTQDPPFLLLPSLLQRQPINHVKSLSLLQLRIHLTPTSRLNRSDRRVPTT